MKRRPFIARGGAEREGAFQAINITPFTDVLLVLLIIFLIAGSSLTPSGVSVGELSRPGQGGDPASVDSPQVVVVGSDGSVKFFLGERSARLEEFSKERPVYLKGKEDTSSGPVVRRYDELLRGGFTEVRLSAPSSFSNV